MGYTEHALLGYFDFAPLGEEAPYDQSFRGRHGACRCCEGRFVANSPLEARLAGWSA